MLPRDALRHIVQPSIQSIRAVVEFLKHIFVRLFDATGEHSNVRHTAIQRIFARGRRIPAFGIVCHLHDPRVGARIVILGEHG